MARKTAKSRTSKKDTKVAKKVQSIAKKVPSIAKKVPSIAKKNWQSTAGNFDRKLKYVKEHSLLADLTVRLVNNEKITVHQVHGIFFSMASEVFEKMIVSKFKEGLEKAIEIKNVKSETFEQLLAYVYNQPVNLTRLIEAEELLQLADYYLIDDLKTICASYCEELDDVSTICYCIELAEKYDLPNLKKSKLKYVEENTEEVLQDQSFLKTNEDTIASILDLDCLTVTEFDLFKFVEKWIKCNLEKKGMAIVDLLIPKLRYRSMDALEFAEGPIKSKLLKLDQVTALSYYQLTEKDDFPLPPGFTKLKRKSVVEMKFNTSTVSTSNLSEYFIVMSPNKNITISGINIFTLNGSIKEVYEENIRITVGQLSSSYYNSNSYVTNWTTILELKKQVNYSSQVCIPIKEFSLKAGIPICMAIYINSGTRKARNLSGYKATWKDFIISFTQYYDRNYGYKSDTSPICSIKQYL